MKSLLLTFTAILMPLMAAEKPNIIFIMADDQGYGDTGSYNPESKISTPGVDRIAREGIRFTDAHSGSAVCTPTRYGLLTGRYSWRSRLQSGVLTVKSSQGCLIAPSILTVPEFLKEQGYQPKEENRTADGRRLTQIIKELHRLSVSPSG